MRWILIVLGVLVLAWVGATLRLVFFPVEDDPGKPFSPFMRIIRSGSGNPAT